MKYYLSSEGTKEGTIYKNMNESQKYCIEQSKLDANEHIL